LRIRNKSFRSDFGSGSGLQLVFGSGSVSWIRMQIRNWPKLPLFLLKFLRSFIFKHKKSAIHQLRDLATMNFCNEISIYVYAFCTYIVFPPMTVNLCLLRRKIRLIESNAKCRHLRKLPCKGTLRHVFYLPEAEPHTPHLTHCICVYSIPCHTGKGGAGES
jgi:hypothetical protein